MKKNKYYLIILPLCALFLFNGKKYDESVIERIHFQVNLCLEGQQCGQVAQSSSSKSARSVDQIYTSGCAACHDAGVAGSPVTGNISQWANRIPKGMDMLVNNAYNGYNAMPAKGLCTDCSKDEIAAVVKYILDKSS
ncbi:c-type cytochrome [Gammaproteobacteria bacterium]|nr:c-type cytochrome [Gammaproteobacteria bacterium]